MPPKDAKPKKLDAKELEALRIQEELRKKEEEDKLRQEEAKKYEVKILTTGLELIITEYCVKNTWDNEKPKEFLLDFITRYLTTEKLIKNFNSVDLNTLIDFHIYNIIFAKENLHLDEHRTMILMNLLWELLKFNNYKYLIRDENDKKIHQLKKYGLEKNKEKDFENFKNILIKHSVENPPESLKIFSSEEFRNILEYAKEGYFNHYNLYAYIFSKEQEIKELYTTVYIDFPLETLPLKEARFLGTDKSVLKDEEEEIKRQIQEKVKIQEEKEKKIIEDQINKQNQEQIERDRIMNELDPKTLEIIREKIKNTEDHVQKMLEDRQKDLDEKFENIIKQKKK